MASEQLPANIQTLLQLVVPLQSAFELMLADQDQQFSFGSFDAFAEQMVIGVTGTATLYLAAADVTIGVNKLLALDANDLRDLYNLSQDTTASTATSMTKKLVKHRPGKSVQSPELTTLLVNNHLVDNAALNQIGQFNERCRLNPNPLSWGAVFDDQITWYDTLVYCEKAYTTSQPQQLKAIDWALSQAKGLSEFAHYYCLYLDWDKQTQGKGVTLDTLVTQLTVLVLQSLECPVLTRQMDASALNRAIVELAEQGETLGFTDFASGLLNIVLNIDLNQSTDLVALASDYLTRLQQKLTTQLAVAQYVNQAGTYLHYRFELSVNTVLLNLNPQGCLTIYSDRPKLDSLNPHQPTKRQHHATIKA